MEYDFGLDDHGQPLGLGWNAHRRAERDISELLGVIKGMLADGEVSPSEADYLRAWIARHPDATTKWPVSAICHRIETIFRDGRADDEERADLKALLDGIVGGTVTMELKQQDGAAMPYDDPAPAIEWSEQVFVFTGQFAYGTRRCCEKEVISRGGHCAPSITKRVNYVVIGTFGSRDWVHTSFGRKIQRAVEYRDGGVAPVRIIGEDHWARSLAHPS